MIRRPPRSTRTDTLFPCATLFRSLLAAFDQALGLDLLTIGRADLRIQPKDAQIAPEEIEAELDRRQAARAEKDFALSDEIRDRSEEHTSELQSLMRISYADF